MSSIVARAVAALLVGVLAGWLVTADVSGVGFLVVTTVATATVLAAFVATASRAPHWYVLTTWVLGIAFLVVHAVVDGALDLPRVAAALPVIGETTLHGLLGLAVAATGAYVLEYRGLRGHVLDAT